LLAPAVDSVDWLLSRDAAGVVKQLRPEAVTSALDSFGPGGHDRHVGVRFQR
jgi:hypothetical protein